MRIPRASLCQHALRLVLADAAARVRKRALPPAAITELALQCISHDASFSKNAIIGHKGTEECDLSHAQPWSFAG